MQNFNYHTHTYRCGHADYNMSDEEYVKEFIKHGFKKMAFTDHMPIKSDFYDKKGMRMDYIEKGEYLESIKNLKEKYKDDIYIKTGFEIEYLPKYEDELFELKKEVDILVLGQHYVCIGDNIKKFRHHTFTDEDLIKYAENICTAIKKGLPDIIVHPDLYMLARETFGTNEEKVARMICKCAEEYDIPLEINLTEPHLYLEGIKNKVVYPCKEFWEVVSKYDIRVLYGIDAHYRGQIRNYEKSINLANEIIGKETIEKLNFIKDY